MRYAIFVKNSKSEIKHGVCHTHEKPTKENVHLAYSFVANVAESLFRKLINSYG